LAGDFYEKPRLFSPLRRIQLAYGCLYLLSKLGVGLRTGRLTWGRWSTPTSASLRNSPPISISRQPMFFDLATGKGSAAARW